MVRASTKVEEKYNEIYLSPTRPLPCLHRLQEGPRKGLACSFVGNHEVQHQRQPYSSHQKPP